MKINVCKLQKSKALDIHKDYLKFLKANIIFLVVTFVLYAIGNFSEYVTFNSKDFINIQNSTEHAGVVKTPSLSMETWFFFLLYWLSFYITPTLMLWFHRNSNVSSGKVLKAKKINFGIIKSFGSVFFNFRIYILVLLVSFFVLLMISFLLKTFPEIKQGIDLIVNLYGKALNAPAGTQQVNPFVSPEFTSYLELLSGISYFRIFLGCLEVIFTALVLQVVYFVSIPLVAIHKDIGVFRSLFLSFKGVIVNWHVYLSISILLLAVGLFSKLVDQVFIVSRITAILLSVIIFPYLILIHKSFFKKAE